MARGQDQKRDNAEREEPEFLERLVGINRVAKTTKGGRNIAFAALMVVGDGKGRVGYGHAKSKEAPEASQTATGQGNSKMHTAHIPQLATHP